MTTPSNPAIRLLDGCWYAEDPHAHYAWMREHAPLFWDEGAQVWGVATYAELLRVSKDPETFCSRMSSRPDSPPIPSMINLDDPEHRQRRGLVNKGLTPRRVQDHEPRVRRICNELVDRVAVLGRCDFVHDLAAPLPMAIIGDLLGVEPEDRAMLLHWSDDMLAATSASAPPEALDRAMQTFAQYADYARGVIADRRVRPRDDMMSTLVHAEIDGRRLGDEDLIQEGLLILVGGDETTRHVISGGMEQLLLNPDQRKFLIDDFGKIPTAVEEMLRWVSPIKNMCRTVTHDTEFMGQQLHEGQKCMLLYESANRDETKFADPYKFYVEREPNEHVAFGFGAHFCLGQALARLELRVMFEQLLTRMPDLELAVDPSELPRRPANFISGLESMPVRFTPSAPLNRSTL
jgi:cytochrome P450 family 142 subfamily A polypeptide 1